MAPILCRVGFVVSVLWDPVAQSPCGPELDAPEVSFLCALGVLL